MTDLLSSRPRSKDTTPKNFWTLLLFKINEMEARLFSLRKFWTSWYIHVSGNIWRKIPENCKVGAMKLLRRKPGREKTFLPKKFETKHISVSETRWSFYPSTCISSCFSFLSHKVHIRVCANISSFNLFLFQKLLWGLQVFLCLRFFIFCICKTSPQVLNPLSQHHKCRLVSKSWESSKLSRTSGLLSPKAALAITHILLWSVHIDERPTDDQTLKN